jgi:DNA-nicking Smr family endonuclease
MGVEKSLFTAQKSFFDNSKASGSTANPKLGLRASNRCIPLLFKTSQGDYNAKTEAVAVVMGYKKGKNQKGTSARIPEDPLAAMTIPITDSLDLHTFSPAEIEPLIQDYCEACLKKGIHEVRIIHGKGMGVQRRRVQSLLSRNPLVESYHDADPRGGGWGATIAVLKSGEVGKGKT